MNNKKNLKMKPVGSEYMEQYNALLRYVFQVTEQELSSIGWQEREIIRAKFPTMEKAEDLRQRSSVRLDFPAQPLYQILKEDF